MDALETGERPEVMYRGVIEEDATAFIVTLRVALRIVDKVGRDWGEIEVATLEAGGTTYTLAPAVAESGLGLAGRCTHTTLGKVGCAVRNRVAMGARILRHCHKGAGRKAHKRLHWAGKDVNMTELEPARMRPRNPPRACLRMWDGKQRRSESALTQRLRTNVSVAGDSPGPAHSQRLFASC